MPKTTEEIVNTEIHKATETDYTDNVGLKRIKEKWYSEIELLELKQKCEELKKKVSGNYDTDGCEGCYYAMIKVIYLIDEMMK